MGDDLLDSLDQLPPLSSQPHQFLVAALGLQQAGLEVGDFGAQGVAFGACILKRLVSCL
ncbi:hypothetical protein D3C78_1797160 [compost metagenome]